MITHYLALLPLLFIIGALIRDGMSGGDNGESMIFLWMLSNIISTVWLFIWGMRGLL